MSFTRPSLGVLVRMLILGQGREKKQNKIEQSGLTEEELIAQQQELFRSATNKYQPTE